MRICDLTHAYTDTSGGIRTYIDAKRRHILNLTDWEHTLVIPSSEDRVEHEGRLTTIHIKGPLIPGAEPYRLLFRADKVLAALEEVDPHLIELTSQYTCPWMAYWYRRRAARQGRRCAISGFYLTDLPSAYVEPAAARLAGDRAGRIAKTGASHYVRNMLNRADLVMTTTDDLADSLRAMGVDRPVKTAHLGVDTEMFRPDRRSDQARARFGAGPDDLILVYAGRLDSEKDVLTLADAFERLPDEHGARLVLMGEGSRREVLTQRAAAIEAREGEPRLFVLPYVDQKEELAELLASSDIYVTAGPHETFALSVVEAQAAGLPVVGVAAGALRDRVPERLGRLGPVGDADAMARNITHVAHRRHEMGQAAREHVVKHLSWESTFSAIFSAYQSVAPVTAPTVPSLPIAA